MTATRTPTPTPTPTPTAPAARRVPGRAVTVLRRWSVLLVVVVAWELAARRAGSTFFPPPTAIAVALVRTWFSGPVTHLFLSDLAVANLLPSLARALGGWTIAVVVGVAVGLALGRSAWALDVLGPVLAFVRAVPPPLLVPVFLVWFDLGTPMQLATIVVGVVWPVLLSSVDGARSVHPVQVDTARAFRVPTRQWVVGVVFPAALPKVFAGMRVSLSLALILMVISELVGTSEGLGLQLAVAQRKFDFLVMWTGVVLLAVLGHLLNAVLLAVEHRVLRRRPADGTGT